VYRKRICATREFAAFGAYISFFPQLVAGPIERAENLLPQFLDKRDFDYKQAVYGMRLMLWGFFKKIVIADNCGIYVDSVWNDYTSQSSATLLLAAVLFSMQIYADFSGYSDIAIGTARLFGIRLSDNFNSPYFAQNIADFWRRWHISLTSWFRDYVYIPLGGNRKGKWQTIINTLIVFSLCGLWHGANWTFVVWGLYNAALFVPMICLKSHKKANASTERREWYKVIATFVLVALGWIVFRAPSMTECWGYLQALGRCDFSSIWIENFFQMVCLVMAIVVLLVFEWKKYLPNRWWVYYVLLFFIWWFAGQDVDFIYFQF
jgi:D-alanyl-lipoteichoic acid acyltransferase DltB (MBOAT superfamily)